MEVDLHPNEVEALRTQFKNDMTTTNESTNKRDTNGDRKDSEGYPKIQSNFLFLIYRP